ncbi:MAG: hypothetical protein OEZ16_09285 [Chromatiales bacterium]|nr:hypothetical protein [Chromatiales bacterium]
MLHSELLSGAGYSGRYNPALDGDYEGFMMLLSSEEKADPTFQLLLSYMFFNAPHDVNSKVDLSTCIDEVIRRKISCEGKKANCA